jgi:hypothetical protein
MIFKIIAFVAAAIDFSLRTLNILSAIKGAR